MSLQSIDITKKKRLSLGEVKLPAPEVKVKPPPLIEVEIPPTAEEIIYQNFITTKQKRDQVNYDKLKTINPLLDKLVDKLDLVSTTTGERISQAVNPTPKDIDKAKLTALALKVIPPESSYTREEVVELIKEATKVSYERAERGFSIFLKIGVIAPTLGDDYYLASSTPF